MDSSLVRYILENQGTYTPEAIRTQLRDAGHTDAEIDAAWRLAEEQVTVGRRSRWALTGCIVLMYGPALLFYGFLVALFASEGGVDFLLMGVITALVVAAMVGSILYVRRSRAIAMGLAGGIALGVLIPFMLLFIITGLCFVVVRV